MIGHAVDFDIIFTSEAEEPNSEVEAKLEYPSRDGGASLITSSVTVETGKVSLSFVFEAHGDLNISLSRDGELFFKETIPLQQ